MLKWLSDPENEAAIAFLVVVSWLLGIWIYTGSWFAAALSIFFPGIFVIPLLGIPLTLLAITVDVSIWLWRLCRRHLRAEGNIS